MSFEPYSNKKGELVTLICHNPGRPGTKIWTEGRVYLGRVTGYDCGLIKVHDDLGCFRLLSNDTMPSFPMGTSGKYLLERKHTALFTREE